MIFYHHNNFHHQSLQFSLTALFLAISIIICLKIVNLARLLLSSPYENHANPLSNVYQMKCSATQSFQIIVN